jgi:uncharacterized protein YggE
MRKLIAPLTALFLAIGSFATPANAAPRHITVSGVGTAMVTPDAVRFFASVSNVGATNKAALSAATKSANAVRDALKANGIATRDIKTSSLTVYPEYSYNQNISELVGYRATQSFTVVIRKADNAGTVIDAVVDGAGDAVQINGVAPFLIDGTAATQVARQAAVKDARARASSYAKLLGQSLGRVIFLTEASAPSYVFPMLGTEKAADSTQIDLGETEVSVTVTVRWALN